MRLNFQLPALMKAELSVEGVDARSSVLFYADDKDYRAYLEKKGYAVHRAKKEEVSEDQQQAAMTLYFYRKWQEAAKHHRRAKNYALQLSGRIDELNHLIAAQRLEIRRLKG